MATAEATLRAEDLSPLRRWLTFAAIMAPYVFYAFCWNTENFLRPYMAEALSLDRRQVASFYTAQALGALFGAVIISQLADRYGRRNTFVLVCAGFGLAAMGAFLVSDYESALVQRLLMGFFLGGVFGCTVGLYVGIFPPAVRGLLAGIVQLVYNGGDAALSWFGRHYAADSWQMVMVIGGAGALVAGMLAFVVVPNDRRLVPWGGYTHAPGAKVSLAELFVDGRWRLTLRLALLCGLNFFAFQSFSGWASTYLKDVHRFDADAVGKLLTVLHVGSMVGAICWGLLADRLGRRFNALGMLLSGVCVVVYLLIPTVPWALAAAGFAYGFCLVCTGVWGPYFAELYPDHLRATAASIFNWGRVVSLFGALLSGHIAESFGLQSAMYAGALTFALAAILWWTLPETLVRPGTAPASGGVRAAT